MNVQDSRDDFPERLVGRNPQAGAITQGMKTLYVDGIRKVVKGITTLEEVYRNAKRTEQDVIYRLRRSRFRIPLRSVCRGACTALVPSVFAAPLREPLHRSRRSCQLFLTRISALIKLNLSEIVPHRSWFRFASS